MVCFWSNTSVYIFQVKRHRLFEEYMGHAAIGLRNTVPLLILFQILRFISARTIGQELVAVGRASTTDLFEERRITIIDFIAFAIYIISLIILLLCV